MDCTKNSTNMVHCKLRQRYSIHEGVSLLMIDNTSYKSYCDSNSLCHEFPDAYSVFRCATILQCIKYLKKVPAREHVILLIIHFDKDKIHTTISQLEQYHQIQAMLILHPSAGKVESEDNNYHQNGKKDSYESKNKVIEYFSESESMFANLQQLITDTEKNVKDLGLFTMCNSPEKALRDLRRELGSFVWTHTFRVLLVAMPHNSLDAKRQMLRACYKYCYHHPSVKKKIQEFKAKYRACDAIRWYTKTGFLSSLVNRTLRSENVYALYIFRYFIFDLCESLAIKRYAHPKPISVYRGTILRRDEVEQIRVGSFVSTNGFLSSSQLRSVALAFISSHQESNETSSRSRNDPEQFVLFQIDIDINQSPDLIVADISGESDIPDEHEFLFDLGTTFTIKNIFYDERQCIWNIQMIASNEVAQLNRAYDGYMRERLAETKATILFGRMLAHLGEYSLGIKYFHRLLRVLPIEHEDRGNIHYQLARMYRFLGKHQQAIHYFQCAKLLQRRGLPNNNYEYGMTLAGLGTVYLELNDSKRAVSILEQASICYNLVLQNYNTETIFHFNRLSYAYYLEKQYEKALQLLNKPLTIYKEKMPVDHPGHAQTYHNLGLVHRAMGDNNAALVAYKEALRMREALLAPNHPYVARTCYQMALIYEDCQDYHLALEYAKKALDIQKIKLPSNHHELPPSNELVTRLSAKVKQII